MVAVDLDEGVVGHAGRAVRLNLWDFDDTLAQSADVIYALAREYPEVPVSAWWRDVKLSTVAALQTEPYREMWRTMARTPGRNVLFSGRVPEAVEAWIENNRTDLAVAAGLRTLLGSIPVARLRQRDEMIVAAKIRLLQRLVADGETEIHVYDDHPDLPVLLETARLPGVTLHRASHGRLINGVRGCACPVHRIDV